MEALPPHLENLRTRVSCGPVAPNHTETIQYSGAFAMSGFDNSLQLEDFCCNFKVDVKRLTEDEMEFDMIGIDAAIANAFRRILIAEIPTMAIEKVLMVNNTSVIPDEVLAHRLGLIPLDVDPRFFEYFSENDAPNERNTIVFKLDVSCKKGGPRMTVKSDQLKWLPNGSGLLMTSSNQSTKKSYTSFSCSQDSLPEFSKSPIQVKHPDIIISKLGPGQRKQEHAGRNADDMCGMLIMLTHTNMADKWLLLSACQSPSQKKVFFTHAGWHADGHGRHAEFPTLPDQEIELEAHAVKGVGKVHAKWSPVSTAWYRMLPEVELLLDVKNELAEELKKKCPANVFDIEDIGKGVKKAVVSRPRDCTLCRECIRGEDWEDRVALRRVRNHFIFTVESAGGIPPEVLFTEAVKVLEEKCDRVISELS